jgi:hypothetical protein
MQKILIAALAVLLLFVLAEGGYYLVSTRLNSHSPTPTTIPTPTPSTTVNLIPNLKILYLAKGDNDGKTLIYQYTDLKNANWHGFSGVGFHAFNPSDPATPYLTGSFNNLAPITNSSDVYLDITNPLNSRESYKARVIFGASSLVKTPTRLGIEHLVSPGPGSFYFKDSRLPTGPLSAQLIQTVFKKGDAIVVSPVTIGTGSAILKDQNNVMVAEFIAFRTVN